MKNTILLSALAVLALASCQTIDTPASNENAAIDFSTYQARVVSKAAAYTDDIYVSAVYTETPTTSFFSNVKFTFDTDRYVSNPVYYWPVKSDNSAKPLDFYAVSPTDFTITDKTVEATISDGTKDLVAASLSNQTKSATRPQLAFGHKLNKIAFKALGSDTGLKYVIKAVTVKANSSATYTYSSDSWSSAATSVNYPYTLSSTTVSIAKGTTTATLLGTDATYGLMLIPNQPSTEGTVQVSVQYDVIQEISSIESTIYSGTKTVNISTSDWAVNKFFIYTLKLSAGDPIEFTATLADWDTATEKDLTL